MKIILDGYGGFPVLYKHMHDVNKKLKLDFDFYIICNRKMHWDFVTSTVNNDKVFLLEKDYEQFLRTQPVIDDTAFDKYTGNIYSDISSEKRSYKKRSKKAQISRAKALYELYCRYFDIVEPDIALVAQVEGITGKIFCAVARQRGVRLIVPYSGRNLGGYFFSEGDCEVLPSYCDRNFVNIDAARKFVTEFRKSPSPAIVTSKINRHDILPSNQKNLVARLSHHIFRIFSYPRTYEIDNVITGFLRSVPIAYRTRQAIRRYRNEKLDDVESLSDLPKNFIYYPLQYSPESSINSPAPFFIDQLRAIDIIRMNMPSDCQLVIKDHPNCIGNRTKGFYQQITKLAGVQIVNHRVSSIEIIKRAKITISVTGTSVLEAFILGKPSFALSSILCSQFLHQNVTDLVSLKLQTLMEQTISDEHVVESIARIQACLYDIEYATPDSGGNVLSEENVRKILFALKDHIKNWG